MSVAEGRRLRDEALDLFADRDGLREEIDREMRRLYLQRECGPVSTRWVNGDDASKYLDAIGYTGERRVIGTVFGRRRGWRLVGYTPSILARRHARPIACWALQGGTDGQG